MKGEGLKLTGAQARYKLSPTKPLDTKGGIRITVRGHTLKITGALKPTSEGEERIYYTLTRPTKSQKLYTKYWDKLAQAAIAEIDQIEKSPSRKVVEIFDDQALRYQELLRHGESCHDLPSLLSLLQALGNLIGKDLPAPLVELMQGVTLACGHKCSFKTLITSGRDLEDFIAQRPYMPRQQLLPYFAQILPDVTKLPDNEELIKRYLSDRKRLSPDTLEQYGLKLRRFNVWLDGKPFLFVTSEDVANHIVGETEEEVPGEGTVTVATTHDQIRNILHSFFAFLRTHNYFPKVFDNPVKHQKLGNKNRDPDPSHILDPADIQRWMDNVRWEDLPYLIFSVKLGIRSDTIPRLMWDDVKWDKLIVEITRLKSKCGSANPKLTPEVLEMLLPFQGCTGPVVVHHETPERVRTVAIKLGIVKEFNNNGRKSAISYGYAEAIVQVGEDKAAAKMDEQFGNSKEVRNIWYKCPKTFEESQRFRACKREMPKVVLSHMDARRYLGCQYAAFVRTTLALKRKAGKIHAETTRDSIEQIAQKVWEKAHETYGTYPSLPSFVQIDAKALDGQILPLWSGRRKPPKNFDPLLPPSIIGKLNQEFPTELDGQPSLWSRLVSA